MSAKIAEAGAGNYGASVAIRLAEHGHDVRLFDPLGILCAAPAINQYRVHGGSSRSLFGSAKNTNHWTATDPDEPIPEPYASILKEPEFRPMPFTRFEEMRQDCCKSVPSTKDARYLGSRFTIRVVEDDPEHGRRILLLQEIAPGEIHIFSGKVVSAVTAARLLCERIAHNA